MIQKINLTCELARLLNFTAAVATAIRMYSAYNPSEQHLNAPEDLMWLSDCLHNLDMLGRAVVEEKPANIVFACDVLLTTYADRWKTPGVHVKPNPVLNAMQECFHCAKAWIFLPTSRQKFHL